MLDETVLIVQGQDGSFELDLKQGTSPPGPFDLTNVYEIAAIFPGLLGPVVKRKSAGAVTVVGAPGSGRIQVAYAGADSAQMNPNPSYNAYQDLDLVVTLGPSAGQPAVAQVDTITLAAVVTGTVYSIALNGVLFSYTATATDTPATVLSALYTAITVYLAAPTSTNPVLNVSAVYNAGTPNLVITSTLAGLGFSDVVSNLALTNTTANAGTRAIFRLRSGLSVIAPQDMEV